MAIFNEVNDTKLTLDTLELGASTQVDIVLPSLKRFQDLADATDELKKSVAQNVDGIARVEQQKQDRLPQVDLDNIASINPMKDDIKGKQDKLTAGAGIAIINNVISSTGGKVLTSLDNSSETPTFASKKWVINDTTIYNGSQYYLYSLVITNLEIAESSVDGSDVKNPITIEIPLSYHSVQNVTDNTITFSWTQTLYVSGSLSKGITYTCPIKVSINTSTSPYVVELNIGDVSGNILSYDLALNKQAIVDNRTAKKIVIGTNTKAYLKDYSGV